MREPAKVCATKAGTCEFIAQVSARSPSAPNLRPAMKTMFGIFGSALMAASSSRSQLSVSTPRPCSQSLTAGSLKRATPMTRRSGAAAFARPASVGPIFPATPKIMISPPALRRSSISAWLGRHSRSSRSAISAIVAGRVSRVSSMFFPLLLQPDVANDKHPLQAEHEPIQCYAQQRQEYDGHHHRRRIERGLHLDHEIAEAALGGDEFADNGAGHRQDRADLHPGKHVRQRARQLNLSEQRPARAAQRFYEVQQIRLDLAQPARSRQQDRKEAD